MTTWIDKAKEPKAPPTPAEAPEITLAQAFDVMHKHGIFVTGVTMENDVHSYQTIGQAVAHDVVTGQRLTFSMEAYPATNETYMLLHHMQEKTKAFW